MEFGKYRDIRNVAVIGAGLMGRGIAQEFAAHGYGVKLMDNNPQMLQSALAEVKGNLKLLAEEGLMENEQIPGVLERIQLFEGLENALTDVDYVTEAVFEDVQLKQELFHFMDRFCPEDIVLASNTSGIAVKDIAERAEHKHRILVTHFWNPPNLVPLVEVVPGEVTSVEAVERAKSILVAIGKRPVVVRKDVPGFVGNRLQHALWREASFIVEEGIASPQDVDEVVKYGFGMRLPIIGPFETADLAGLDLSVAIQSYLFGQLSNATEPFPTLTQKVREGKLGVKTKEGFYTWTTEQINKVKTRRDKELLRRLKESQLKESEG